MGEKIHLAYAGGALMVPGAEALTGMIKGEIGVRGCKGGAANTVTWMPSKITRKYIIVLVLLSSVGNMAQYLQGIVLLKRLHAALPRIQAFIREMRDLQWQSSQFHLPPAPR